MDRFVMHFTLVLLVLMLLFGNRRPLRTLTRFYSALDRRLYFAKGVRPEFGRDLTRRELEKGAGDNSVTPTALRWIKFLVAIILGNALYFALSPHLPPAARHETFQFDLGTIIDFWFCLMVYGVIELVTFLRSRQRGNRGEGTGNGEQKNKPGSQGD